MKAENDTRETKNEESTMKTKIQAKSTELTLKSIQKSIQKSIRKYDKIKDLLRISFSHLTL